ncbi:MAG TPA: penicillin acylase family protein [Chloroflexota bacterium]|nr:penicillin acylase family protein [Chloroflexota bacterium]
MLDDGLILSAMRGDQSVAAVCAAAGITVAQFQRERDAFVRRRLPPAELRLTGGVVGSVEIMRDRVGVPHVYAAASLDLWYGLGFAMAQDRLWQMDFFRRRGDGRLAEVLGESYLHSDVVHRTIALDRIATREVDLVDERTRAALDAFVAGINRAIDAASAELPIEFAILGYRPAAWIARDVIVSLRGFWWSLNGRLQSIVAGEAASHLPAGPLRDAFLTPELPDERIVPPGSPYPVAGFGPSHQTGAGRSLAGSDDGATGSNNWAVGAGRTRTGAGVLGSDPHQPFMLPSNWYECRLSGPEDDAAGAAWAGAPGIWFGRNRRIAWGLTNNNASTRDLYAEEIDPHDPSRYRDGTAWPRFVERMVEIAIRGRAAERLAIRETVRGPVVNQIVPSTNAQGDPPLSLRWVGQEHLDDARALLAVGRAQNWPQFRAALADWSIPTFNWGFADVEGHVGYQCASRMPLRGRVARGFRDANDARDSWIGYIPYEAMPRLENPPRGFIASANNAAAPDDYPYPLYGALGSGGRAIRIRETIEQSDAFDRAACVALQNDTLSVRAREVCPHLLRRLLHSTDPDVQLFCRQISGWDYRYETSGSAPTFFEMFFKHWKDRVASERFPSHLLPTVTGQGSILVRLLVADDLEWFRADKSAVIGDCVRQAVADVRRNFGDDPDQWTWGAVHRAHFRHPLSNEATADLFDVGPAAVSGSYDTVRNTGLGAHPLFGAESGAEYRLVVDLSDPSGLWATQNIGQSGQPGSPHYANQFADWVRGEYHQLRFDRRAVEAEQTASVKLEPEG